MMSRLVLTVAVFSSTLSNTINAFSNSLQYTNFQRVDKWGTAMRFVESSLHAYVFPGADESDSYYRGNTFFHDDESVPMTTQASPAFLDFINKESAALARLAVAYSPKDRTLNIKNINQVSVLNLASNRMDIAAVVCDDESCVSLAVPVSFPKCCKHTTSAAEFEMCIIDNLGLLNSIASKTVNEELEQHTQQELSTKSSPSKYIPPTYNKEMNILDERIANELKSDKDIDYPDWWAYPNLNLALAKECDAVRLLINQDDFQYDLQVLVSKSLEVSLKDALESAMAASGKLNSCIENKHDNIDQQTQQYTTPPVEYRADHQHTGSDNTISAFVVHQAAVAALGPAGMILKASVSSSHGTKYDYEIIDIPYRFTRMIHTGDMVRDAVLEIIDAFEDQECVY